jgi:hypothetical protein
MSEADALFVSIDEQRSLLRYEPGKWSIRELLSHINDAERVFAFRAFWFARGLRTELPKLDQDVAVQHSAADRRTWASHVKEFRVVRHATLTVLDELEDDAWDRRGIASGHPVTVRALAYICAGHVAHHLQVLRERYLSLHS